MADSSAVAGLEPASQVWTDPATGAIVGVLTRQGVAQVTAVQAAGLPGATAGTRLAGGTASGAPSAGTFQAGDVVTDQSGSMWVCTAAGSPGTWASGAGAGGSAQNAQLGLYPLDNYAGTDDAKFALALAAVQAAGGGTIQLSPRSHTFASQWATALTGSTYYLRVRGAGAGPSAAEGTPTGATSCNMTYAGAGAAKMDFHHSGTIAIEDIAFTDTSGDAVPFFQCTNTSPKLRRLSFAGSKVHTACNQDAIYLGGGNPAHLLTDNDDAPFQGYQGVIEDISFYGIRTGAWARSFANSVSMRDLSFYGSCGTANVFRVTDAAMTAASAVLTCATSAPFTSGMVGQAVIVTGAGLPTYGGFLVAVIAAFTSATQVTLSTTANVTVSAAVATAPAGAPIQLGGAGTMAGVQGCVIDDCLIEMNNYAIGVLLQQSANNAVIGTAMWDGTATSLLGVACVNNSFNNTIIVTEPGVTCAYSSDANGTNAGLDLVFCPAQSAANVVNLPGLLIQGSSQAKLLGAGATTGTALAFGPLGGPADAFVFRDGAGSLNLVMNASGSPFYKFLSSSLGAEIGQATSYANVGPQGTGDVWYTVGGSNANISLNMRAQGTSVIKAQTKIASQFAGTPAIAASAGGTAGAGATFSVSGNDQRGTITVTTGTGPAAGDLATVTFTTTGGTWPSAPFVVVSGDSAAAAALMPGTGSRSATVFHLQAGSAPAASTAYTFNYICMG